LFLALIGLLAACSQSINAKPIVNGTPIKAPEVLATPAAFQPAAGICGEIEGQSVTVVINPDVPDPRCVRVKPTQKLTVINHRGETIQVQIGPFEATILPNDQQFFDLPFGDYLAPGVHQMVVSPCCGGEIVLDNP
jgi:hypothetical protein